MNNEQVIKYVSENSKHPHAAMIVEWLLTGWEVEYLQCGHGIWDKIKNPSWDQRTKYRLVKPKMKPAYMVYRSPCGMMTGTVDKRIDGTLSHDPGEVTWISNWIEYDPEPKQWPTPLVERIAAIDIKAAEWIRDNWDELLEDKYNLDGHYSRESPTLCGMFFWELSDQGDMYWRTISNKLGE